MVHGGIERRAFPRINHPFMVRFKNTDNPNSDWDLSTTRNISANGVLFTASKVFAPGTLLELGLTIPSLFKPISIKGRVVRTESSPLGNYCRVATEFTDIDIKDRTEIDKTVKFLLSSLA